MPNAKAPVAPDQPPVRSGDPHTARLSLSPQFDHKKRGVEAKPDHSFAKQHDVGVVTMQRGDTPIAAAIGARFLVSLQESADSKVLDHWRLTLSPSSPNLHRRLFAERNATIMDAIDVPIPQHMAASYDAVRALEAGVQPLSDLHPPMEGAVVEVTYALDKNLQPVIGFKASSVEAIRRLRRRMIKRQAQNDDVIKRACWPLDGPIYYFRTSVNPEEEPERIKLWPWGYDPPDRLNIPEDPGTDEWAVGGEDYWWVGQAVAKMEKVFNSLWRAVFAQDLYVAEQLVQQGYDLSRVNDTCLGMGVLMDLMRARQDDPSRMTTLGDIEDLLDDLPKDVVRGFFSKGQNTNYEVEIDDEDGDDDS